jgi:CDP-diacylglycerol--glycerol-3-phosphate 3-phosphatidyltransferase/archaetidylinositol phosphate synthase
MTMDSLRSKAVVLLDPFVKVFQSLNVSANSLSMVSMFFAILAGIGYYFSMGNIWILFLALVFVFLNAFLDGADGLLARKTNSVSKYGDFLDHVIDRYADVFIIGGACLGGYVDPAIGIVVLTGILLASYLGTQAQAVGIGRVYGGIMGRADRLVILIMATSLNIAYTPSFGLWGYNYSVLGWALIIIGVASHITALQRIWHTRKMLLEDENKNN